MRARNILRVTNVLQQVNSNTKEGMSIDKRTFIAFIRDLIDEYGTSSYEPMQLHDSIQLNFEQLPISMQYQYLKQYLFFEGYTDYYEEIYNKPHKLNAAIEEEKENLQYWLDNVVNDEEESRYKSHLEDNDITLNYHTDNGEPYEVRR